MAPLLFEMLTASVDKIACTVCKRVFSSVKTKAQFSSIKSIHVMKYKQSYSNNNRRVGQRCFGLLALISRPDAISKLIVQNA